MRPVTKMIWLIALIIIASALCFVILDDEDTKGQNLPVYIPNQTEQFKQ